MSGASVKISLEIIDQAAAKALSNFISNSDKADKGLKKVGDSGSSAFREIGLHIGKATGFYEIFAGNLLANLATKAFDELVAGASKLFNVFVVDGVTAAKEQEESVHALNVALAAAGNFSAETAAEFEQFAGQLQATTGVQDDVILKNAALIESLTQLDSKGLQAATRAALDMASALGRDLSSASEAVAKAANGNVTALQKMGITIEKGNTDAETFANTLLALESRFGGAAAAKINTYAGAVTLVQTSFGEFQETIGDVIVKNNVVIEVLKTVTTIIQEVTGSIKDQSQSWKEMVAGGILTTIQALNILSVAFDSVTRVAKVLFELMTLNFKAIVVAFQAGADVINGNFMQALRTAKTGLSDMFGTLKEAAVGDTAFSSMSENLSRIEFGAQRGFDALKSGASTSIEPLNSVKGSIVELTEEQKKLNQELENWIASLANANLSAKGHYETSLAELQASRELELIGDTEFNNQKLELIEEYFTAEAERIELYRQSKGANQAKADAAEIQLEKNKGLLIQREQKLTNDQRIKGERAFSQARVDIIAATANLISALTGQGSREAFYAMKAAALAQAYVSVNLAAAQALAVPPAPNFGLAALAKIAGGINIAAIAATAIQGPAFEQGGIVPGTSYRGDTVAARVNSGEMILNRSQQAELFKMANGSSGNSDSMVAGIMQAIKELASQPIQISIDGKQIFNVIRDGQRSGRSFA